MNEYDQAALRNEINELAATRTGGRNHALNKAAFSLGRFVTAGRLSDIEVREALLQAATQNGLIKDDGIQSVNATINSGLSGAELKPRDKFETEAEVGDLDLRTDAELLGKTEQFWQSRPVLQHVQAFAYSRMTAPWAVLGGCLLRAISHIDHDVTLPPIIGGRGSANLLVALVGPSGAGKGASEAAAREAFTWPTTITAPLGSGEGITHAYGKAIRGRILDDDPNDNLSDDKSFEWRDPSHSIIFNSQEIDQIAAISGRRGSTLMGQLRSAYSGETLGFSYADESRKIVLPEHSYRFGLSVGVQPGRATILLEDADGGTPQRFLWLPVTDAKISAEPGPAPAPQPWIAPLFPHRFYSDGYATIPVPDLAIQEMRDQHVLRAQGVGEALDGHALYTRLKTAVGLMMLEQRTEVSVEDWELAGVVMLVSDHTRKSIQEDLAAKERKAGESKAKAEARNQIFGEDEVATLSIARVARKLERRFASQSQYGMAELRRMISSRDRIWFEDAVQQLVETGRFRRVQNQSNFGAGEVLEVFRK